MHVIKKNVPIPRAIRAVTPARRKYPFDQMDVGDMFFVPNRPKNTLATHASTVGKQLGMKFITRHTYMIETDAGWEPCNQNDEGAVPGVGVWRVEKDGSEVEAAPEPEPAKPAKKKASKPKKAKAKAEPEPEPEPEVAEPEQLDEGWDDV